MIPPPHQHGRAQMLGRLVWTSAFDICCACSFIRALSQPRPRLRPRRRPFRAIPGERGPGGVLSPDDIGLARDRA